MNDVCDQQIGVGVNSQVSKGVDFIMFAIVKVGSSQYKVSVKDTIDVDRIHAKEGGLVTLKNILLLSKENSVQIGQPVLKNVELSCRVLRHSRSPKQIIYRYRRRKSSHKKIGHRQNMTSLLIEKINVK